MSSDVVRVSAVLCAAFTLCTISKCVFMAHSGLVLWRMQLVMGDSIDQLIKCRVSALSFWLNMRKQSFCILCRVCSKPG